MKFVKLTNALPRYLGDPVYINVDKIMAVYAYIRPSGGIVTAVFSGDNGLIWEVEEGVLETVRKIEEAANDSPKETS